MPDFKKEWLAKAEVDYYSQFMSLWLSFNSWYRSHYSELSDKNDRQFIEKIKSDFTLRNPLYTNFNNLIAKEKIKENIRFKSDLESLYYSLNRASIKYPKGHCSNTLISFDSALYEYNKRKFIGSYEDLMKKPHQKQKVKLNEIFITSNLELFFACLIEILYQVRCLLFHGNLEPTKENHEVIKYCYSVLLALLD